MSAFQTARLPGSCGGGAAAAQHLRQCRSRSGAADADDRPHALPSRDGPRLCCRSESRNRAAGRAELKDEKRDAPLLRTGEWRIGDYIEEERSEWAHAEKRMRHVSHASSKPRHGADAHASSC